MTRSMLAPVIADTGFIVMLPHNLYQMSWRMLADTRGVETGAAQQLAQRCTRGDHAAGRLADDQALAHALLHQAGLGREGAGMHHAADHLRQRQMRAAMRTARVDAVQRRAAERRRRSAQTTRARRSSPAAPACARRAAARCARATSASAGPLTATTTRSMHAQLARVARGRAGGAQQLRRPGAGASRARATRASVAPRATALTWHSPAAASRVPMKPPMAPAP